MKSVFRLSTRAARRRARSPARSRSVLTSAHGAWSAEYWLTSTRAASPRRAPRGSGRARCDRRPSSKPPSTAGEQRLVGSVERARLGHRPEVAVRVRQRAVDEVAPVREQLVVVAPDELGPGEVGVLRLGARGDQVVAERVRVVALEEVAERRSRAAGSTRTACPPSSGTRSRRRRPGGRASRCRRRPPRPRRSRAGSPARSPYGRRCCPCPGSTRAARLGVLPPLAPGARGRPERRPLDARRQVADHGVEPDVDALVRVVA